MFYKKKFLELKSNYDELLRYKEKLADRYNELVVKTTPPPPVKRHHIISMGEHHDIWGTRYSENDYLRVFKNDEQVACFSMWTSIIVSE